MAIFWQKSKIMVISFEKVYILMEIRNNSMDAGKAFDWGRTSKEYARYRDIYPDEFYQKIIDRGLCVSGQNVLDLGTGTGVLPRNLYHYGAKWTGTDISPEQIREAERLAKAGSMDISFMAVPAEQIDFPAESFHVITACQCFWYFDHARLMPKLSELLKPDGKLLILYMAWFCIWPGFPLKMKSQEKARSWS